MSLWSLVSMVTLRSPCSWATEHIVKWEISTIIFLEFSEGDHISVYAVKSTVR